jgi:hypothetical protein
VITKIVLWLQKIALLFGISCTEINQSQSNNIFKYIIIVVQYFDLKKNYAKQNSIQVQLSSSPQCPCFSRRKY